MITAIRMIFQILTFIIIADAIVSFVLPPYHTIRTFLDRIVDPMLNPIRRIMPTFGGMDFSPIVLILLINLVEYLVISLLR
jgi:YggT family protein